MSFDGQMIFVSYLGFVTGGDGLGDFLTAGGRFFPAAPACSTSDPLSGDSTTTDPSRDLISGGVKLRDLMSGGVKLRRELISGGVKLRELISGGVKLREWISGVDFPEEPSSLALAADPVCGRAKSPGGSS